MSGHIGGSSPRMRGTVDVVTDTDEIHRFIPAHAGNSAARTFSCSSSSVHPRACGEQFGPTSYIRSTIGSSPRMRGTVPSFGACQASSTVHPRACGEQAPSHDSVGQQVRRFIPAHAGNRLTTMSLI